MTAEVNDLKALLATADVARRAGRLAEAERLYGEAVALSPEEPEPRHHLAGVLRMQGRLAEAEAEYRRVLALAPGAAASARVLAVTLLAQGRYEEGFQLLEARHVLDGMRKPALPFAEWRGEEVAGKRLLIWPEQGFGDQIQYARFAGVLKARGADVTLLCYPELVRLFEGALGVRALAASGAVEFPDPDFWVMQGSLAARLGCRTPEELPNAPYLRAVSPWPSLGEGFKMGIKPYGNPGHSNDRNRSLGAAEAERLKGLPARVIDLDPAATGAKDFADTAAILDQLDLVICVDTSVAHLAGAMGKPCWVLLPAVDTDWRWLLERSDSPWYPSIRLFRQQAGEDWRAVLDRVEAAFAAYVRSRQQGTSEPGQGLAS
ncbi:tetratricopeptide repeat protein [Phenylobacterium soli]|uniref:tetratricopeptide repeat protein n=1 Tax=Phenylobacterium soli TaxID=2170551 RepID=UPI001403BF2E|nr:tetratricopeptide repeat protein [Phenylobacterium soli]